MVYKLQEYDGVARRKRSTGKATWPGRKEVWRRFGADGICAGDTVALADEARPGSAVPLLAQVMRAGRRIAPSPTLDAVRAHCSAQLASLPPPLKRIVGPWDGYTVAISPAIRRLADQVDSRRSGGEAGTAATS
jgi:nicotinate phosphoribosyltransferase